MQINITKSASQNLMDLINSDNGTALTEAEISFGVPAEFDDGNGGATNDRNSQVEVSAVEGGGYTDSVTIRYYRLDLDILKGALVLERTLSDTSTLTTVRDAMATTVGLIKEEVKLVDDQGADLAELPTIAEGETATVYLAALSDSYCYIGQTAVTLHPKAPEETPVGDEVTTTDASGFDYPEEEAGQ